MDHKSGCNHSNCNITSPNESVRQTISEMDWERGIWNAAYSGEKDRMQFLIDKAKNSKELVNCVDNYGYAPLHYAARNGHIEICSILLKYGALINTPTRSGRATPLHKAAAAGKTEMVEFLVKNGAQIDVQDADGKTALHKAAENNNHCLIDMLLKVCPKLRDIKDNKNQIAL